MFLRDDMIDLAAEIHVVFMDQAILAEMVRPQFDKSAQVCTNA